jgi:phospholipid/cholesterol/gamma-HCH transport system substrate-binding protein
MGLSPFEVRGTRMTIMDERVMRLRVGLMVLVTFLITGILVAVFGDLPKSFLAGKYTVYADFDDAPGVSEGSPVKKSGILIGRVTSVELLDEGGARVTIKIDADKRLRANEVARITSSLLGDSSIQFVDSGRKGAPRTLLEDGAKVEGIAYDDPIQVIAKLQDRLSGAVNSVAHTSDELGQVVHQVGELLDTNKSRINNILEKADSTAGMAQQTIKNLNELIGDPKTKGQILETLEQMPQVLREARDTIGQMGRTMTLVDKNLQNLDKFTGSLGEHGDAVFTQLGQSAQKLDGLLNEMVKLTKAVNSGEGSLGKLVNDPELYDQVNRTVGNVEELTRRLRPILEDVRVFTDKIARHPEQLGVRGAIERKPGIK